MLSLRIAFRSTGFGEAAFFALQNAYFVGLFVGGDSCIAGSRTDTEQRSEAWLQSCLARTPADRLDC